jgi:hypothetical protein
MRELIYYYKIISNIQAEEKIASLINEVSKKLYLYMTMDIHEVLKKQKFYYQVLH